MLEVGPIDDLAESIASRLFAFLFGPADYKKFYPEAAQQNPTTGEPLRVIDSPSDDQKPNVRELKYLAFSVTNGDTKSTVIVGIS